MISWIILKYSDINSFFYLLHRGTPRWESSTTILKCDLLKKLLTKKEKYSFHKTLEGIKGVFIITQDRVMFSL